MGTITSFTSENNTVVRKIYPMCMRYWENIKSNMMAVCTNVNRLVCVCIEAYWGNNFYSTLNTRRLQCSVEIVGNAKLPENHKDGMRYVPCVKRNRNTDMSVTFNINHSVFFFSYQRCNKQFYVDTEVHYFKYNVKHEQCWTNKNKRDLGEWMEKTTTTTNEMQSFNDISIDSRHWNDTRWTVWPIKCMRKLNRNMGHRHFNQYHSDDIVWLFYLLDKRIPDNEWLEKQYEAIAFLFSQRQKLCEKKTKTSKAFLRPKFEF